MPSEKSPTARWAAHAHLIPTRGRRNAQIYLEVPRARVTRMLSKIKEDKGDEAAASELLQDLQVETFGSMERREKTDFILEQMRLLRLRKDWDRFGITAKKINTKWFSDKESEVRPGALL
jgi:26S proteasome regulatory subunit N5